MPRTPLRNIPPRPIDPAAILLDDIDAARLLGLSRQTLAGWRSQRTGLPFIKLNNGRVRYRRSDIDAFVNARLVPVAPDVNANPAEGA
jgi:predicted DNA-binding transcriptional regulator AlpA